MLKRVFLTVIVSILLAGPALAGFAGTDVLLPSVGRGPGAAGSNWYTTVWVHNPNSATVTVQIYLLERQAANPSPFSVTETVQPGETKRYTNAVSYLFGVDTFGALRFVSSASVVVNGRIYSQPSGGGEEDSTGQFFTGIPASFAIGSGQSTQLLGVYQTTPAAGSQYRYNFGFVETTGGAVTVRVTVRAQDGAEVDHKDYTLGGFGAQQYQIASDFPTLSTDNARLEVAVTAGAGQVLAFGSGLANSSNDPSTFEMSFADELLAENVAPGGLTQVEHDASLIGSGTSAAPLGIADGGVGPFQLADSSVGKAKLAAPGGAPGEVLGTDGTNLLWLPAGGGFQLPFDGATSAAAPALSVTNTGTGFALAGFATSDNGVVGTSGGSGNGVYGESVNGYGLYGRSSGSGAWGFVGGGAGVYGEAGALYGVLGKSASWGGVRGESETGYGVEGYSNTSHGMYAETQAPAMAGVLAVNTGNGTAACMACGPGGTASAGDFTGNVYVHGDLNVSGSVSKGGGSFKIDHPLDPENRYLYHSFVESPDMMNIYNGNVVTDASGLAVVELPEWFEALNRDFRYQLTVIGRFAQAIVEREVEGNRFAIRTSLGEVKVSWQVTGIRKDAYANLHRIPVEEEKSDDERGTYLHPDAFGQPAENELGWSRRAEQVEQANAHRASVLTATATR